MKDFEFTRPGAEFTAPPSEPGVPAPEESFFSGAEFPALGKEVASPAPEDAICREEDTDPQAPPVPSAHTGKKRRSGLKQLLTAGAAALGAVAVLGPSLFGGGYQPPVENEWFYQLNSDQHQLTMEWSFTDHSFFHSSEDLPASLVWYDLVRDRLHHDEMTYSLAVRPGEPIQISLPSDAPNVSVRVQVTALEEDTLDNRLAALYPDLTQAERETHKVGTDDAWPEGNEWILFGGDNALTLESNGLSWGTPDSTSDGNVFTLEKNSPLSFNLPDCYEEGQLIVLATTISIFDPGGNTDFLPILQVFRVGEASPGGDSTPDPVNDGVIRHIVNEAKGIDALWEYTSPGPHTSADWNETVLWYDCYNGYTSVQRIPSLIRLSPGESMRVTNQGSAEDIYVRIRMSAPVPQTDQDILDSHFGGATRDIIAEDISQGYVVLPEPGTTAYCGSSQGYFLLPDGTWQFYADRLDDNAVRLRPGESVTFVPPVAPGNPISFCVEAVSSALESNGDILAAAGEEFLVAGTSDTLIAERTNEDYNTGFVWEFADGTVCHPTGPMNKQVVEYLSYTHSTFVYDFETLQYIRPGEEFTVTNTGTAQDKFVNIRFSAMERTFREDIVTQTLRFESEAELEAFMAMNPSELPKAGVPVYLMQGLGPILQTDGSWLSYDEGGSLDQVRLVPGESITFPIPDQFQEGDLIIITVEATDSETIISPTISTSRIFRVVPGAVVPVVD